MADTTKKRFFEILGCVEDPKIDTRELPVFWRATVYADVLLRYNNEGKNYNKAMECMRGKGFAPKLTIPEHTIILAGVRFNKYTDPAGDKRLQKKKAKYGRWLEQYQIQDSENAS